MYKTNVSNHTRVQTAWITRDGRPLSFIEVSRLWVDDPIFRDVFSSALAQAPFAAYRWETPPVTTATGMQPFEWVLVDDPSLERPADPAPFREHLAAADGAVCGFTNRGGDSWLITPTARPEVREAAYGHLARFVRHAPRDQIHALWQQVGRDLAARLGARPRWLSTAGDGVAWLHVRIDTRPKYYAHAPYRRVPGAPRE